MQGEPIPPVRGDLEYQRLRNGKFEIRDPHLLQILTVDEIDLTVARFFDGVLDADGVTQRLEDARTPVRRREVQRIASEFAELKLLDTPDAWDSEPIQDNVSPWSQLGSKRLRVLPVAEEGARWACHGCGACCHGLYVELTPHEEARIDASLYQDVLKGEPFVDVTFVNADEPARRVLRTQEDGKGACIFLTSDGLCRIHARQGMAAKPNACQAFPLMVVRVPKGRPRLGLRVNCQSMYKSFEDGAPLSEHAAHAVELHSEDLVHSAPARVVVFGEIVPFADYDAMCADIVSRVAEAGGLDADVVRAIDRAHLKLKVRKRRKAYGERVLDYIREEVEGDLEVSSGAYVDLLARVKRGRQALRAMSADKAPPAVKPEVAAFLGKQLGHVLHVLGPLNLPDAGVALVGLFLAVEAVLHAIGPRGDLADANTAFDVFTHPLIETTSHAWPILDAVDPRGAKKLRKEMS